MITIKIKDKEYRVDEARTEEQRKKGLQGVEKLPENEGMLFFFDPPEEVSMWMKGVDIPLDIIFFNEDQEAILVHKGKPNDETLITVQDTAFVLELNEDSGVEVGDDFEFDDNQPTMKVLFPDGSDQYELWGGERIFSRKNTRILIKKAKKAQETQDDKDYKALGKYMFKCIKKQNERPPEYVQGPSEVKESN